ncbi:hypothetical protein FD755_006315, partial [Muntiacus reevesi]
SAIFVDAQVSSAVFQLKRITDGIPERPPDHSGCTSSPSFRTMTAQPRALATVGLAFRPFSSPPELPGVMEPGDPGGSANEPAAG